MLRVHECRRAAGLLRLGDHLQGDGRLARRFRPEDFDHAPAGESADAERRVERNDPVGITEIGTMASFDPRRMIEPLPNCFSICETASVAGPLIGHGTCSCNEC